MHMSQLLCMLHDNNAAGQLYHHKNLIWLTSAYLSWGGQMGWSAVMHTYWRSLCWNGDHIRRDLPSDIAPYTACLLGDV